MKTKGATRKNRLPHFIPKYADGHPLKGHIGVEK
jgi:hypothetical protein